jgi:predicted transcriptional regulator
MGYGVWGAGQKKVCGERYEVWGGKHRAQGKRKNGTEPQASSPNRAIGEFATEGSNEKPKVNRISVFSSRYNMSIFATNLQTMLTKEKVRQTIERLPDSFTVDQVIEELVILNKIEEGLKDVEEGNVYTTEQIHQELKGWLK